MTTFDASYDTIADEYAEVAADHNDPTTIGGIATRGLLVAFQRFLGTVNGLTIGDLGCGEGHFARRLANDGAQVVGIDVSARLLDIARQRTQSENITYVLDDAQELATISADTFDAIVANLAFMDIPNLDAAIESVKRVLKVNGFFFFSLTHPCFQTPKTEIVCDDGGTVVGRKISQYAQEGFWRSDSPNTIRGRIGAYHRTLSTYINTLLNVDFTLRYMDEPTLPAATYDDIGQQIQTLVPSVMIMVAQLSSYSAL